MAEAASQLFKEQTDNRSNTYIAPKIGEKALWGAGYFTKELGVNDPLTHLKQYLDRGETAMPSIEEDLITDCAERLEKPRFINAVVFDRLGDDFVSRENRFSMRAMTDTTEYKFAGNALDIRLYQRAKIESKEVDRLKNWFENAQPNDSFIVESMPLTKKESYTIVRFYQKVNDQELIEHVVTLHNSSVDIFNKLHAQLQIDVPPSQTSLELLDSMYAYNSSGYQDFEAFLYRYVDLYDGMLAKQNPGKEFKYGLDKSDFPEQRNDIALARSQKTLRSIYTESVRALGRSDGWVTPDVARLNDELKLGLNLRQGAPIPTAAARELLDSSLQYIVATLNRASESDLNLLAAGGSRADAVESASHYGGEARAEGVRYEGACPSGAAAAAAGEAAALAHDRRVKNSPECVFCPKCQKTVDADKEYFKRGWWHCADCKSTAPRHGVRQRALPKEKLNPADKIDGFELILISFKKIKHGVNIKRILKMQALAQNEFEQKRQAKLLRQAQEALRKTAA